MKTNPFQKPLTFGDFVERSYRVWGARMALGMIRLAARARLIEFSGQRRIEIP
jgi:hypothetical protein